MEYRRTVMVPITAALLCLATAVRGQVPSISDAIHGYPGQRTGEVLTAELRTPSMYVSDVAEVGRLVGGNTAASLVLYCNGPHCGKSKRLADELVAAGYSNVRRYQLGIPVWRALGSVVEIELDGLRYVLLNDRTAVVIDVRDSVAYRAGTLPNARHIPRSGVLEGKDVGEVRRAKDDGRLPMTDHNTRIVVVGSSPADTRFVAEALAREAFDNVAFYRGTIPEALAATGR